MRTRSTRLLLLPVLLALGSVTLAGCVRRIHEAPGLPPGSDMAVSSEMRLATFEVEDFEVRPFRIPISETNRRRYQFAVLRNGVHQFDYTVERMDDGAWALMEARPDGITIARESWPTEPSYATARVAVIGLLRPGTAPLE